tara:strand:+ start:291 stop:794 length:504 start_codon:yes stop_codon:yes gene_type:complete
MKTSKLYIILGLTLGCISASAANAVAVNFVDSDKFTDFTATSGVRSTSASFVKELSKFISRKMEDRLPPGFRAEVVITDVDMAGEFEPWRSSGFDDVRIVKDLYPPRINLSFRVVDEAGELVIQGDRKLRDLNFMYSVRPLNSDLLRYEKTILSDWIRREFRESALT